MAFRYEMTGPGVDKIQRRVAEAIPPGPGEVQVRMRASSLNFHDYATLTGLVPWVKYPRVPMSDGCGEVVAVGEGVEDYAPGDRVVNLFYPLWHSGRPSADNRSLIVGETVDGCLQEFFTTDSANVVRAPSNLDDAGAAALVCAGHTAWYALVEECGLRPGQTVLVQGTGGVSLFALQIARAIGARVVATSSSDEKLARLEELGAEVCINYAAEPEWHERVTAEVGGVDAVVDVGGESTLGKSVACANTDGFIAVIGILGGFGNASVPIIDVMQKTLNIRGVTVGCGASLDRLCRFVEANDMQPVISHRLPASDLAGGVALMENGGHFGKIAIDVD